MGIQGLNSGGLSKLANHYIGLKDRPGYDGFLSTSELQSWALSHPNSLGENITPDNTINLDGSKLDLGHLRASDLIEEEMMKGNLHEHTNYLSYNSISTTYAIGSTYLTLISTSKRKVRFQPDTIDWGCHDENYTHSNTPPLKYSHDTLVWMDRIWCR